MRGIFILFFIVCFISSNVYAQSDRKFQVWTDFDPSYIINEHWQVGGDLGYRFQPSSGAQTAYIRPGFNYKPGKIIKFTVGVANFNNWYPDVYNVTEFRIFEFVHVSWPRLGNFQFKHRLGLEQRWFYVSELGLDKYVNRSRYFLEVISPNFHLFGLTPPFFITANFEILRDLNKNELGRLIDHNRFTIGLGNHITDRFRADIRFKVISLIDPDLNNFITEIDVLRIRFYYQFPSS